MSVQIRIKKITEKEYKNNIPEDIKEIDQNDLEFTIRSFFNYNPKHEEIDFKLSVSYFLKGNEKPLVYFSISTIYHLINFNDLLKEDLKKQDIDFEKFINMELGDKSINLDIPQNILLQIIGVSYSTMRGMLVYKLSDTPLSKFYLPLVHPKNLILEDKVEKKT